MPGPTPADVRTLGDPVAGPADTDTRGTASPTAAQQAAVDALGAVSARWGSLGAVLLRQDFDGLAPALGGLVAVAVADRRGSYVSSSLARTTGTAPAATLTPLQGWLAAATD